MKIDFFLNFQKERMLFCSFWKLFRLPFWMNMGRPMVIAARTRNIWKSRNWHFIANVFLHYYYCYYFQFHFVSLLFACFYLKNSIRWVCNVAGCLLLLSYCVQFWGRLPIVHGSDIYKLAKILFFYLLFLDRHSGMLCHIDDTRHGYDDKKRQQKKFRQFSICVLYIIWYTIRFIGEMGQPIAFFVCRLLGRAVSFSEAPLTLNIPQIAKFLFPKVRKFRTKDNYNFR